MTPRRPRLLVVAAIGMAQILAWGSSYYLPAVLAAPEATATGWGETWIIGALSLGLLVSGLVSPQVGHLIERFGGRPVLVASALLLAAGLVIQALAFTLPIFILAWLVLGLGMGAGLYDPAFSTLGRLYGDEARSAITQVTLFAGFTTPLSVGWPLSNQLANVAAGTVAVGWASAGIVCAYVAGDHARPTATHRSPAANDEHGMGIGAEVPAAFLADPSPSGDTELKMCGVM